MSGMAEVLAGHSDYDFDPDAYPGMVCACGVKFPWIEGAKDGVAANAAHQAEMLTAAGFGPVKEAKAQALEEAASDFIPAWFEIKGGRIDRNQCHREWLRERAETLRRGPR